MESRCEPPNPRHDMSRFSTSLFDHLKRCGRDSIAWALMALSGLAILVAILRETGLHEEMIPARPGIGVLVVAWAGVAIRRARARWREQAPPRRLPRDELRVARSKLMKDRNLKKL